MNFVNLSLSLLTRWRRTVPSPDAARISSLSPMNETDVTSRL